MSTNFISPPFFRKKLSRRALMGGMAGAAALAAFPFSNLVSAAERKGRIRQSVCPGCFGNYMDSHHLDFDQTAAICAKMGLLSIEFTSPDQWPTLKKHGLVCAIYLGSSRIDKGWNRVENHKDCLAAIRRDIDAVSAAGFPNVICFSGNRGGMKDDEGLKNCVAGLKQIAPYAEEKKVTLCMEFLNSHSHTDYMADSTKWCVELVHQVKSPRFKVLYDIFHAGMMKEDALADIKNHADCWGHYHTAGVPGRHEIDDTQTLDYRKIMTTIAESGYQGYVGHEYIPKNPDALKSLEAAVAICDV